MAFVDALFPNPKLIHDLQVNKYKPVAVTGNGTREQRISKWRNHQSSWIWPSRAMLSTDRKVIENFITDVADFGLNSFKFQDPNSSFWNTVQLAWAGDSNKFKITARGGTDTHPIYHLGPDIVVRLNGTPAAYTFDKTAVGGPVIAVTGATSTDVVTIGGTFYYAVRLDAAEFGYGLTALDMVNRTNTPYADTIGDIPLLEVFEY